MVMAFNLIAIAEIGKGRLTVGKIYGGLLILENWKATKFGKMAMSDSQVMRMQLCHHILFTVIATKTATTSCLFHSAVQPSCWQFWWVTLAHFGCTDNTTITATCILST